GFTSDSTATILSADGSAHLWERDRASSREVNARLLLQGASPESVHYFSSSDEANALRQAPNYFAWRYQYATPRGWWALSYGNQNLTNCIGISGAQSAEGPNWRDWRGHFCGYNDVAGQYYLGVGPREDCSTQVRGGHFYPGDRFELPSIGTPGSYIG